MKYLEISHNNANHKVYPPFTCSRSFGICFCVPNNYLIIQRAGKRQPVHIIVLFLFLFCRDSVILKCICLRRNLLL